MRSGGSAATSDLAAELDAAAAGVGARPQPILPTIPAQFMPSPAKPWTFKRAMSVCLVAIASVSFTLRVLQGVRLLLACGDVDFVEVGAPRSVAAPALKLSVQRCTHISCAAVQQPMRCRAVATLITPPFFTLAVVVIGRCFAVGEDTRCEPRPSAQELRPHSLLTGSFLQVSRRTVLESISSAAVDGGAEERPPRWSRGGRRRRTARTGCDAV